MAEAPRPRWPTGLRGRLAIYFAAIVILALAAVFVAVYRGTGSALRQRVDSELSQEVAAMKQRLAGAGDRGALSKAAHSYVSSQPFGPSARLLIVSVRGGATVTNEPELLRAQGTTEPESTGERSVEVAQARSLRHGPFGFSDVQIADVGDVRLLSEPIIHEGVTVAEARAGEPLAAVESAQHDVARTFLVAGGLTALAAVVAGVLVAVRIAAPLRRMARTAAQVDAGELSHRIGEPGPYDEVRVLAASFDHMLDRLEDAFAAQRAFVSDASHELRTPLTVIRGQLEVLARQADISGEDFRRVEHSVVLEVERMERLVEDLLRLARIDERRGPLLEDFELAPFVSRTLDLADLTAARALTVGAIPPGWLRGDPKALAQVIRNLVRNAVEHTPRGGQIAVSAETHADRLRFAVEDDGEGIPSAERERVFERFHRGEHSRRDGSGLGLSIARAVINAHSGRIWAEESKLGGARIVFDLPGYSPKPMTEDVADGD